MKKKKVLIIDNYDSFTYNLYHLVREIEGCLIEVFRNDKIAIEDVAEFDKIILSPGPGIPEEAGLLLPIVRTYAPHKSILGVCLGHQAIGEALGAKLENLSQVYHGIQTPVHITGDDSIFKGLQSHFLAGRYHSWIISRKDLPKELMITAESAEKQIMAIRHTTYDVHGIQFHPESILTPKGQLIIENFLNS